MIKNFKFLSVLLFFTMPSAAQSYDLADFVATYGNKKCIVMEGWLQVKVQPDGSAVIRSTSKAGSNWRLRPTSVRTGKRMVDGKHTAFSYKLPKKNTGRYSDSTIILYLNYKKPGIPAGWIVRMGAKAKSKGAPSSYGSKKPCF